ncbi:uncharacterized protein LOC133134555 [Conger conger]|uniref:uncharacterized protein LOC133134555 n=1 Tax=Conger conger TaxID=82655 RepID=UPI002A5B0F8A|nr:uncharacterized protein LOC133134555 [Conger conger]
MECPQCRRECGQNDRFCSDCAYDLCSAKTPVTDSDQQEGPEHPVCESHTHSNDHAHSDGHAHSEDHTDPGPPEVKEKETVKEEEEKSQQRDTIPEHITSCMPVPGADSEYQEETTDNRSRLGPEPAPEKTSSCLAQSQPSADPAKSDLKSGLVETGNMDGTLSQHTKDPECTAQEEEETEDSEERVSVSKDEAISKEPSVPGKLAVESPVETSAIVRWVQWILHILVVFFRFATRKLQGHIPTSTPSVASPVPLGGWKPLM